MNEYLSWCLILGYRYYIQRFIKKKRVKPKSFGNCTFKIATTFLSFQTTENIPTSELERKVIEVAVQTAECFFANTVGLYQITRQSECSKISLSSVYVRPVVIPIRTCIDQFVDFDIYVGNEITTNLDIKNWLYFGITEPYKCIVDIVCIVCSYKKFI